MESVDNDYIAPATTEESKSIKAINKDTVHKICSGQVVLNLATAVKELIENSVDAGATAVEVRLKEHGSELLEVSDNGSGVLEENFQALTLKHHTSKLRDFSDLPGVETFGFRGEALSSLCALSNLCIITRHKSADCGTKLEFDHRGVLIQKSHCARQVGSTVILSNLFSTLPVRQKEFHKHLKREFNKMTQLLYAYCLAAPHVKITCTNQTKGGGRSNVVSTQGNRALRDNIASLFGAKQLQSLLDIHPIAATEDVSSESKRVPFSFEGVISSCAHGSGRSSNDRQFYFVNSRPCEPAKVMKVVNEVYRQFNNNQSPFVFLNLKVERADVDVNVTPDKRQIFLNNEKLLLTSLRQTLISLFESIPSTMKVQNSHFDMSKFNTTTFATNATVAIDKKKASGTRNGLVQPVALKRKMGFLERFISGSKSLKLVTDSDSIEKTNEEMDTLDVVNPELSSESDGEDTFRKKICSSASKNVALLTTINEVSENRSPGLDDETKEWKYIHGNVQSSASNSDFEIENIDHSNNQSSNINSITYEKVNYDKDSDIEHAENKQCVKISKEKLFLDNTSDLGLSEEDMFCNNNIHLETNINVEENQSSSLQYNSKPSDDEVEDETNDVVFVVEENKPTEITSTATIKTSIEEIKLELERQQSKEISERRQINRIKFRSEINPANNKSAEQELEREISKEMFAKMDIIGQFNLGFIVVKLDNDLFIIDQHASDEKFNFEDLQRNTVLQSQKLVVPQLLELTVMNESILLDNLDVFRRNGFNFTINKDAKATQRVHLTTVPISHNWSFGKEDIDELLFMLQDAPEGGSDIVYRPSRVRDMLASRACRKSVMVGRPLQNADMRKVVRHMGDMDQPWNCPHGRPTMRHLVNLSLLDQDDL